METTRLETFSDGVFAIAATLLILEIKLPGEGSLTHQLLQLWPSYAAYAVSFVTIGIMWINHLDDQRLLLADDRVRAVPDARARSAPAARRGRGRVLLRARADA